MYVVVLLCCVKLLCDKYVQSSLVWIVSKKLEKNLSGEGAVRTYEGELVPRKNTGVIRMRRCRYLGIFLIAYSCRLMIAIAVTHIFFCEK